MAIALELTKWLAEEVEEFESVKLNETEGGLLVPSFNQFLQHAGEIIEDFEPVEAEDEEFYLSEMDEESTDVLIRNIGWILSAIGKGEIQQRPEQGKILLY